jgi:epoxyqueuosine reductase
MEYMYKNFEKRIDPGKLLLGAKSVIVVGLNYKPPKHKTRKQAVNGTVGCVANFAQYEDYHLFIKRQLRRLVAFISERVGTGLKFKICVDSAPLAERALAVRAGLGFIGKNHMLTNPKLGCRILLGEIITSLKLSADKPIENNCDSCGECVKACPTGALQADGQFNANRCISYLTIEYKEQIPPDLAKKIDNRIFGCDECVLACRWQKDAPVCKNKEFRFYDDRAELNLDWILNMSEGDFENKFAESCFVRTGLANLKRNARICLANC